MVPIKAELDNPNGSLKLGMFVAIGSIGTVGAASPKETRTPAAVLAIPKSALVETNEKKTIVFVQNGRSLPNQSEEVTAGKSSATLSKSSNLGCLLMIASPTNQCCNSTPN